MSNKKDPSSETDTDREAEVTETEDAVEFDAGGGESEKDAQAEDASTDDAGAAKDIESTGEAGTAKDLESAGDVDTAKDLENGGEAGTAKDLETAGAGDSGSKRDSESADTSAEEPAVDSGKKTVTPPPAAARPRRAWLSLLNFLLILCLAAAAGYYWWQQQQRQQQAQRELETTVGELRQQIETRASNSRVDASLAPLKSGLGGLERKIGELETGQQSLIESSEKLFELFGRDKNDWQLAEVEYLLRVAQHKLVLEDDFEGAALTLQAASDRIALMGDPGLLTVRVRISEEIAELKTRKRPDLVGMTLILAQLARQVRTLEPGFAPRVEAAVPAADVATPETPQESVPQEPVSLQQRMQGWLDRLERFVDSLITIRYDDGAKPTEIEADVSNVGETLEDNLKLARWAVLERDPRQYATLIDQSLRLLREFYDMDNAANSDFRRQLEALGQMQMSPEKPDISGSLYELRRILSQRENAPAGAEPAAPEAADG